MTIERLEELITMIENGTFEYSEKIYTANYSDKALEDIWHLINSEIKRLKATDADVQEAIETISGYKVHRGDYDEAAKFARVTTVALLALKAYRPSGQSAEDTAGEGSPLVRENRTTEPVDNLDQLPCDWCDRDILVQEQTFNLAGREINRTLDYHYCPMCGRELRTPLSLPKNIKTAVASEINAEILIDPNCSVDEEEVKRFLISELVSIVEKNIEENTVYKEVKTPFGKALRGTIGLAIRKKNKDE